MNEKLIEYIKENQDKFYRTAFAYVKNQDTALDIVQDAIVKAISNISKLKQEEYMKTWFYRILINESLQYLKKNKKYCMYELSEVKELIGEEDVDIESVDIYNNIQLLNNKIRTVIILRFFEDMTIEEISKITKTNINTVKSRLYKGLDELKKLLESGGFKNV